jgi:hypothetical protein
VGAGERERGRGKEGEREGGGERMDVCVCWVSSLGKLGEEQR